MKNVRLFWLLGIVLLLAGQSLYAQSKKEKREQKANEVKELIDSKRFTIDVNRAIPMGGRSLNLTSPYSLEMRGDSVISYLPYFGRAYSAPYGGGDRLRFEESITDYQCSFNKKGTAQIQFRTRYLCIQCAGVLKWLRDNQCDACQQTEHHILWGTGS